MMRTTLNIPDDVYEVARSLAVLNKLSLGEAVAELIRAGLQSSRPLDGSKAFPCFAVAESARLITLERTLDAEDEP